MHDDIPVPSLPTYVSTPVAKSVWWGTQVIQQTYTLDVMVKRSPLGSVSPIFTALIIAPLVGVVIVPTPTIAKVSLGPETIFDLVKIEMTPKIDHADDGSEPVNATVTWAATARNRSLQELGAYLTAITLTFTNPGSQITDDLQLYRANNDDEVGTHVTQITYIRVAGIPVGWGILGFAVFIMALVIICMLIPRRVRK